jgi:hypothetical protein
LETEERNHGRREDLRDGVLELGRVDALGLLDLPPGGEHLRRRGELHAEKRRRRRRRARKTRESEQELEAPALRVREGRDLILMDLVTGPTRRAAYTWLSA